jgi:hypothetical protein
LTHAPTQIGYTSQAQHKPSARAKTKHQNIKGLHTYEALHQRRIKVSNMAVRWRITTTTMIILLIIIIIITQYYSLRVIKVVKSRKIRKRHAARMEAATSSCTVF